MDQARRAELLARRSSLVEAARRRTHAADRASFVRAVPILAALERAGDDYDSHDYRRLRGPHNRWAHAPAMAIETEAMLPDDPVARDATILAAIRDRLAGPTVSVILRSEQMVIELAFPVLARHLTVLLENAYRRELGFTEPPAAWMVEIAGRRIAIGRLVEQDR